MLEAASLLLQARPPEGVGLRDCVIFDAVTGQHKGVARLTRERWASWLPWPARPVWTIYETEDESLVCTVRRLGWPQRAWVVHDAEGQLVGIVRQRLLSQVVNGRLNWCQRRAAGGLVQFLTADREIGRVTRTAAGLVLSFHPYQLDSPFVRMLLLAAALADEAVS